MNFKAINDSVIVEVEKPKAETRSEGGLIIVDATKVNTTTITGTIVSVGEGKFDPKTGVFIPPPVKLGDKIILSLSTGVELDESHRMVRTDDIFAVVTE